MKPQANTRSRVGLRDAESGSATVEFAIALPAVVIVLIFSFSLMFAAAGRTGMQEYARQAARLASMGVSTTDIVAELGTGQGTLTVSAGNTLVTATVSKRFTIAGVGVPGSRVTESATAYLEEATSGLAEQ